MPYQLDIELTANQKAEMARIPAEAWFTSVDFKNARSPRHPSSERMFEANNEMKRRLVLPWVREQVEGKRVLDLFCANGTFSVEAALAGATEVVGLDFSAERIECARFLAGTLDGKVDCSFDFMSGDVYELSNLYPEPFDVVMALGGLYHIADPPYVLTKIGELTRERFIVQTAGVLPRPGNWAKFIVRSDRTDEGLTSIRGGHGVWRFTVDCFRAMLTHAGFEVLDERRPPRTSGSASPGTVPWPSPRAGEPSDPESPRSVKAASRKMEVSPRRPRPDRARTSRQDLRRAVERRIRAPRRGSAGT